MDMALSSICLLGQKLLCHFLGKRKDLFSIKHLIIAFK
jgi:hypothetical protein